MILALMKSISRSQPVPAQRLPERDVAALCRAALADDLHHDHALTVKVVLLLTLTPGKRRHAPVAKASRRVFLMSQSK